MPAVVARASPSTNVHRATAGVAVVGTSGRHVESWPTSSPGSAWGSGPARRPIREWRRRPPRWRVPFRPSTSTRPIGFRRGPTACSATSRSRRTPGATTCGGCAGICCRSSRPAASTKSTRSSARPSRPTRSARPQTCGGRLPPVPTSVTTAAGGSSRSDRRRSASRHACRRPRRRHRGRSHRAQPCARQAHARARAQASADLPRTGRAARAH